MGRYIFILLLPVLIAVSYKTSHGQNLSDYVTFEDTTKFVQPWDSNIIIHTDPRLDILVKKHRNTQLGVIRSGKGYRVQIYYGNDRAKAIQRKIDFMRRYPNIRTYMTYVHPQYRVKVGDFASREEAAELYRQMISLYGACMIVPDIVVINTLRDD